MSRMPLVRIDGVNINWTLNSDKFLCCNYCLVFQRKDWCYYKNKYSLTFDPWLRQNPVYSQLLIKSQCRKYLFLNKYRISGGFSRVPNFRFIRDSHRWAKKRIQVNFHPFLHIIFIFLNICTRSVSPIMTVLRIFNKLQNVNCHCHS